MADEESGDGVTRANGVRGANSVPSPKDTTSGIGDRMGGMGFHIVLVVSDNVDKDDAVCANVPLSTDLNSLRPVGGHKAQGCVISFIAYALIVFILLCTI